MSPGRRFAIVSPNYYPRTCGVGDHSMRVGAELVRRGHEVAIYSRAPAEAHPDAPGLSIYGAPHRLPTLIARDVGAAIARQRPTDVLLQYTPQMWDTWRFGTPALPLLARRAQRAGARVTLIAHEVCIPWDRRPDLFVAAALQRLQIAALLRICDRAFVTTTSRVRYWLSFWRAIGVPPPGVVRVGANALPAPRPAPVAAAAGPRIGTFTTGGRRMDLVLDAFARIAERVPAAELVLIGDLATHGQAARAAIDEAIRRHPAGARIRTTGKLPLSDVAVEIAKLDVYLFSMDMGANTRSGTLPVALGSGLPVVAIKGLETDDELFRDRENIFYARALDAAAFADATVTLLQDPALAARIGQGARLLYDQHLMWERIVDDLLAGIA